MWAAEIAYGWCVTATVASMFFACSEPVQDNTPQRTTQGAKAAERVPSSVTLDRVEDARAALEASMKSISEQTTPANVCFFAMKALEAGEALDREARSHGVVLPFAELAYGRTAEVAIAMLPTWEQASEQALVSAARVNPEWVVEFATLRRVAAAAQPTLSQRLSEARKLVADVDILQSKILVKVKDERWGEDHSSREAIARHVAMHEVHYGLRSPLREAQQYASIAYANVPDHTSVEIVSFAKETLVLLDWHDLEELACGDRWPRFVDPDARGSLRAALRDQTPTDRRGVEVIYRLNFDDRKRQGRVSPELLARTRRLWDDMVNVEREQAKAKNQRAPLEFVDERSQRSITRDVLFLIWLETAELASARELVGRYPGEFASAEQAVERELQK
jgi:hypothetical protein